MYELCYNGQIIGIFSTEDAATKYMHKAHPGASFSIFPIGTFMETDMEEEESEEG